MTTESTATVIYPETDGMPLPDGEFQAPLYIRIVGILRTFLRNIKGARVNGDTFIYFVQGDASRFFSPDCYVVLGLSDDAIASIERNNTYLLWRRFHKSKNACLHNSRAPMLHTLFTAYSNIITCKSRLTYGQYGGTRRAELKLYDKHEVV